MIKVLLVDDQQLFVENLKIVIEARAPDMEVAGVATSGPEAVDLTQREIPDVILMDVRMPGGDGVEATRVIHQRSPSVRIIMLTTFDNDEYVKRALHFGAVGYILKSILPEELFTAIRAAHSGSVLISPTVLSRLFDPTGAGPLLRVGKAENKEQAIALFRGLSPREQEVVRLIAMAYSNKDIAETLGIAEQTVKNHISRVFDRLGVFKRTELMRMFRDFSRDDFDPESTEAETTKGDGES